MDNKIQEPLKDVVYVLTGHVSRNNDVEDEVFEVLGIYNTKLSAQQAMRLDYSNELYDNEEKLDGESNYVDECFGDTAIIDNETATLEHEDGPLRMYGCIDEREVK